MLLLLKNAQTQHRAGFWNITMSLVDSDGLNSHQISVKQTIAKDAAHKSAPAAWFCDVNTELNLWEMFQASV